MTCAGCGLCYKTFRTGLTFSEVRQQFWKTDSDPKAWVNKRRHTVLGRWREIKLGMWGQHVEECGRALELTDFQPQTSTHIAQASV
jgi:hypothetical protein